MTDSQRFGSAEGREWTLGSVPLFCGYKGASPFQGDRSKREAPPRGRRRTKTSWREDLSPLASLAGWRSPSMPIGPGTAWTSPLRRPSGAKSPSRPTTVGSRGADPIAKALRRGSENGLFHFDGCRQGDALERSPRRKRRPSQGPSLRKKLPFRPSPKKA